MCLIASRLLLSLRILEEEETLKAVGCSLVMQEPKLGEIRILILSVGVMRSAGGEEGRIPIKASRYENKIMLERITTKDVSRGNGNLEMEILSTEHTAS